MVAIIVGMITGSLCMISALYYLLELNDPPQVWGIVAACVGGGVFVLSAVLMAIITIWQHKSNKAAPKTTVPPRPAAEPEPEPVQRPEPEDLSPGAAMPELDEEDFESSFDLAEEEQEEEKETGTS